MAIPTFITALPITSRRKPQVSIQPQTRRILVASAQNRDKNDKNANKTTAKGINLFISDIRQLGTKLKIKQQQQQQNSNTDQFAQPLKSELGNTIISLLARTQGLIERGTERDITARQRFVRNFYVPGSAISRLIRQISSTNSNTSTEWRPLQYFEWQRVTAQLSPSATRTTQRTQREKMIESVKKTTTNAIRASIKMSGKAVLAIMDVTVTGIRKRDSRKRTRKKAKKPRRSRQPRVAKTVQTAMISTGLRRVRREWNLTGYETRLFFVIAGAISAKAMIVAAMPFAAVASTAYVVSEASTPRGVPIKSKLLEVVVKRRSKVVKKVDLFLMNRRNVRKLLPPPPRSKREEEEIRETQSILDLTKYEETTAIDTMKTRKMQKREGSMIKRQTEDIIEKNVGECVVDAKAKQIGTVAPAVLYTPVAGKVLQGVDTVAYFMETRAARGWRRIEVTFGMERKVVSNEWQVLSVFRWQRERENNEGR